MTHKLNLQPLMHDLIRPIIKARKQSSNDIEQFLQKKYLNIPSVFMPIMMRIQNQTSLVKMTELKDLEIRSKVLKFSYLAQKVFQKRYPEYVNDRYKPQA